MDGYFKVHRKILDSQVFAHQTALKIWIWCLAKVTFKERYVSLKVSRGETTVKLNPGQFIFGRFKAEEELDIDGSTIYKWMQKFASKEFEMITIKSNNQYSIITLCNWEGYNIINNSEITTLEQPCNNGVTTVEQPCNTNKNDKNDKNEINIPFETFWNLYDKKVDRKKCEIKWIHLTDQERELCIKKIPEYVRSTPDKKFRRDPETYINNKSWDNEIIANKNNEPVMAVFGGDIPEDLKRMKQGEKI